MGKKIVAILLIATMAMGIAACGGSGDKKDDNTITVWCWDKTFNIFAMEEAAKIYQEDHQDVKIDIVEVGDVDVQSRLTILVPLFQMVAKMKMLNSTLGFILPTVSTPFLIMMFRQSARSFPRDIIEAARLDGLSEIRIFFQMFIPTMKSTYAAAMTITFMNAWNSYMWPKVIMTQSKSMTMPMVVANLTEGYVTDYGMLMLAVLICTLPTALVFFILQKNFAEGITGAVK